MLKIIAIGGGEIGRPGFPVETTSLDKEIIRLSGQKKPRLLFLPTASSDSTSYTKIVKNHFGKRLGCQVEVLYLLNNKLSYQEIKKQIVSADIIYVGGGNTLKMMRVWRKLGIDIAINSAAKRGVVLSGVSAGAICWFRFGQSDSLTFTKQNAPFIRVKGLNLLNILICPHFDKEKARPAALKKMMRRTSSIAIALDDCAALEIVDDSYRIITSKKSAGVYKAYWKNDQYIITRLPQKTNFTSLKELQQK